MECPKVSFGGRCRNAGTRTQIHLIHLRDSLDVSCADFIWSSRRGFGNIFDPMPLYKGMKTEPNKAMERSRILVTDRASARSAPSIRLAHL